MASVDPSANAGRRILVVEDEYLIAEHIALMLEDLGYEVVGPVPTIAEALDAIAAGTLDAVLLDANLGGTSSAPIATELAARRLPFVVVTGYGNIELPASALQAAPRVNKPFTAADLAATLARTMAP
jgi:DNA-binding NtrC family response regulator